MMPMRRGWWVLAAGALVLAMGEGVRADGGFFVHTAELGVAGRIASSPKQEAMLVTDGERVQVILRSSFSTGPSDVAWVVPVPAEPTDIKAVEDTVFSAMDDVTAPRFYQMTYHHSGGWKCGCSAGESMRSAPAALPEVTVHQAGNAGMYDFVVLSARDGDSLTQWLNRHQYHVPENSGPIFEHYVKMNWYWLAMRLRPDKKESGEALAAPHPITYTYASTKLVFPLVISQVSAAPQNEIVLHVLAKDRFGCRNFKNVSIAANRVTRDFGASSGTNYERLFADEMETPGGAFVTEHAMPWSEPEVSARRAALKAVSLSVGTSERPMVVTRLRAVVKPGAMDRDVDLAPAPDAWISNHIYIQGSASAHRLPSTSFAIVSMLIVGVMAMNSTRSVARGFAVVALTVLCLL